MEDFSIINDHSAKCYPFEENNNVLQVPGLQSGPVHTKTFPNENGVALLRFEKVKICFDTFRFRIVFARPHYNVYPF